MPEENANQVTTATPGIDLLEVARAIYSLIAGSEADFGSLTETLLGFWQVYSIIAFVVSAVLLFGTIYAMMRFNQTIGEWSDSLREAEHAYAHIHGAASDGSRWGQIEDHVSSDNPNDWRLAIIEADIMLEDMLESKGFVGATIGDKFHSADSNSFKTLNDARQAHKVRNNIAHRGSDFVLTKRIATDTIAQYRRVFEEFSFI